MNTLNFVDASYSHAIKGWWLAAMFVGYFSAVPNISVRTGPDTSSETKCNSCVWSSVNYVAQIGAEL